MNSKKHFVSVAGNIGSGKSSLTRLISEKLSWTPYFESVKDNPYLEDFYNDMLRWSFNLQVYFLSHRFRIHKEILELEKSVIQDRSIYEDVEIFAKNLFEIGKMEKRDYENYRNLFKEMTSYLKAPDLLIYLKADISTLLNQIKTRGRDFEKNIDKNYIEKLNTSYDKWINNYNHGKTLIVETDDLDFVNSKNDLDFIIKLAKEKLDN
ncbi:MAG: deoxynucleoside kinase [Bacteroidetes bacterium]|nr:deoxynucleoside kinase [Bacteroidota bacterium]